MRKTIIVRYGELSLKSEPVRKRFERALVRNMGSALASGGIRASVRRGWGRMFVDVPDEKEEAGALRALSRVFGIVSFSPSWETASSLKNIITLGTGLAEKRMMRGEAFAVKARRIGQHDFTSREVNERLGAAIAKKTSAEVNLARPKTTVFVEVRDKKAYIFFEKFPGPGGLPMGTQGTVVCIIEKQDDPVSAWLMMKRGCMVIPLFIDRRPSGAIARWYPGIRTKRFAFRPRHTNRAYLKRRKEIYEFVNRIAEKEQINALISNEPLDRCGFFEELKRLSAVPVLRPVASLTREEIKNFNPEAK